MYMHRYVHICTYTHTQKGGQIAPGCMQFLSVFINEEHNANLAVYLYM